MDHNPFMADLDAIRHALTVARDRGFAEVTIESDDLEFKAVLSAQKAKAAPKRAATNDSESEAAEPGLAEITASLVGYYAPASKPLAVGETVAEGDIVAQIIQLGIVNDVESKVSGEVVEVCVEPNQAVMYGQVMARVKEQ